MKIKTESFAATAAITAAAIFTICTALLALFPEFITRIWTSAWHVGSRSSDGTLTLTSYVLGLCFWAVSSFVVVAIAGGIHNRLSERKTIRISFPSVET